MRLTLTLILILALTSTLTLTLTLAPNPNPNPNQAPPRAVVPPAAADAPPIAGSLSFSSRPNGPAKGRAGHKRPRAAAAASAGKKAASKKAPSGPLSFAFGEDDE